MIKINDVIGKSFHPLLKPFFESEIDELVLKGGRGSLKSSFAAIGIVFGMMMDYHLRDELSNAVCLRKVGRTLSKSVYANIKWAIEILDSTDDWYCTKSPLECTYKPSGQKIVFSGCDDPSKIKSIKFEKGFCKYSWFEEVNEFSGMKEVRNVIQSLARGGNNINIYSYNPPPNRNNWCNFEFSRKESYRIIHHSTYLDAPRDWLGEVFHRHAEALKRLDIDNYNNEYLGLTTGYGGLIFRNIQEITIPDKDFFNYDKIRNGLDFGYEDPTAFHRFHYDEKGIISLNELYDSHIHIEPLYQKISQIIFYKDLIMGDSASPGNISELKRLGLNIRGAVKPKNSVNRGIKFLQGLPYIKIDRKRCPKTYWEFSTYEKEKDKQGEFIDNYPDKNNHLLDATRYGLSDIINITGWKLPGVD